MALTPLQRDVSRLLAESRKASGESYVGAGRLSFHPGRIRGAFPTIRG
jgi:hypothetical protein